MTRMNFADFKSTVTALLGAQPAGTWLRVVDGFVALQDGSLIAAAEPAHPEPDMLGWINANLCDVDESAWNGDSFDGMDAGALAVALAKPEFHQFGLADL